MSGISRRLIRHRHRRAERSEQGYGLLRARPGDVRLDLEILPGVRLATLHALLKIQFIFLNGFAQSRRNTGRNAADHLPAVEKRNALADYLVAWIQVEPDQPFRRTAYGDAELVNRQPFPEVFNVGAGSLAPILTQHTLDMTTGVEHTNGLKVEPLGLGDCQHSLAPLLARSRE